MKKEELILDGIGGKDDTKRFASAEKIEAIGERLQKAVEEDFKKFDQAKRESVEKAWQFVVD
ncbi:hypothetical protein J7M28_13570 [bacterium]|nr:hypothetical protein [bacterium]